jgi:hypothetical protein
MVCFYRVNVKVNVKLSRKKSCRLKEEMEYWAAIPSLRFGTTRPAELSAV